jgi:hypothetical protein
MNGDRSGLKAAVRHDLQVIVTVRLNVVRELTQQTIEDRTFLMHRRRIRRCATVRTECRNFKRWLRESGTSDNGFYVN